MLTILDMEWVLRKARAESLCYVTFPCEGKQQKRLSNGFPCVYPGYLRECAGIKPSETLSDGQRKLLLSREAFVRSQSVIIQPVFFASMRANVSTTLGHPFIQNSLCKLKWLILNAYAQTINTKNQGISADKCQGQKLRSLRVRERKLGNQCESG